MAQLNIGNFSIDCVLDLERPFLHAQAFFPDLTDEMFAHCRRVLPKGDLTPDGRLQMRFQSFLLRTGRHTILIDTCCGNGKHRPGRDDFDHLNTDYIGALARAGVKPEQVDFVMCTHLHWDHVGWNTKLLDGKWVPTFPNARYIVGRTEYDYWNARFQAGDKGIHLISFEDSVLPVIRDDLAVVVDDHHELMKGIWLEPCFGHSPGHVLINLESNGVRGLASGDVIHHRIQLAFPEMSTVADTDRALARVNRMAMIERLADSPTILVPAHFPPPVFGRVVRSEQGFAYAPVPAK
jgi:glyoxylase-like metal-dependent hydrolase (beta-lactamase superfamily II)